MALMFNTFQKSTIETTLKRSSEKDMLKAPHRNWGEPISDGVWLPTALGQLLIVATAVLATTIKTTKL
jgi:hypothetical protein